MNSGVSTALHVAALFCSLSILSIGGGNSVLPEMHRKSVATYQWLTDRQFADVFALSQAAPGPSILIVTMIGYEAGARAGGMALGVAMALLATVSMILPAGLMVFLVGRMWDSLKDSPVRVAVEKGLAPLAVGLVLASGWVLLQASDHGPSAWALTALCTVIFTRTNWSPLLIVGLCALAGYLGWV